MTDRQAKNNIPPDLSIRGHKNLYRYPPRADFMVSPRPLEAPSLMLGGTYLPPGFDPPPDAGVDEEPPPTGVPGSSCFFLSPPSKDSFK
ncbi:hypothetical protein DPMN_152253 [Dreissena polymorpha]|uniref:Uncharacterized protein n=1 Tax=Dreissena polymorpha TaxID=45954 RepID=A0A9D4J3Q0_DREPO|nr:hypothetical protein DPMN_152253 [Dreissena polymorpha]